MIQPKIQEVYIEFTDSLFNEEYNGLTLCSSNREHIQNLIKMNCYCFTPEKFEQFKREFGKELLEKVCDSYSVEIFNEANGEVENYPIDFKSVISVLNEFLENNKI